ncbi:MAG: hypothetical protein AAFV53_07050 [Myxococcota bacterium]
MLTVLLLTLCHPAAAAEPTELRPLRPLTYPANPDLSEGGAVNFYRLYVDPAAIAGQLSPTEAAGEGKAELPIINETLAWQEVVVNDTKIGLIGPLTTAVIHDVPAGVYTVAMTNSTGYTASSKVETLDDVPAVVFPGNADSREVLDNGIYESRVDVQTVDRVIGYRLPTPPAPVDAPDEEQP